MGTGSHELRQGREDKYAKAWNHLDYVIFIKNINNCHWVTAIASIHEWKIMIYDNDHNVTTDKQIHDFMLPICKGLPNLMVASRMFKHFSEIRNKSRAKNFRCTRLSPLQVPQCKKQRYVG